jgi:hypothetical protein
MINIYSDQKTFNKILIFLFIILIFLVFYKSTEKMIVNISDDNKKALNNLENLSKQVINDLNNDSLNITKKFLENDIQEYFRKYNIISDLSIRHPNKSDYFNTGNFDAELQNIKTIDEAS